MVNYNFCSILHRFRVIRDCVQTGNDVTPISLPCGAHFSLTWYSDSPTPIYYTWLIEIFALSRTVSELLAIAHQQEMTS